MSSSVENNGRLHEETTEDAPLNFTEIRNEAPRKGEHFGGDGEVPGLETPLERRMRRKSHYIIYFTTFIMSIGFSIILTGVWPYLKQLDPTASKEFLGWVVAANPLGQMLFSPVLGWWANRSDSNRSAFLLTITLSIVGNVMYALLPIMKDSARYLILISRFIVGLSGANVAICRSYIVASTKLKERTAALSATSAAQAIGFILGPIMQSGLTVAFKDANDESGSPKSMFLNGVPWNMYSTIGWLGALICCINLVMYLPCVFQEHYIAEKEARMKKSVLTADEESIDLPKPDYPIVMILLFMFFITQMLFVLLETLLVPMSMDMYAYTSEYAIFIVGIGLSIVATVAFCTFLLIGFLTKHPRIDERRLYIGGGFFIMALAMLLHIPFGSVYPQIQDCVLPAEHHSFNQTTNLADFFALNSSDIALNHTVDNIFVPESNCSSLGCPIEQSWCLYTPILQKPQFMVAEMLAFAGYPVGYALSISLVSKLLGPMSQGTWMGVITSIGGFSRIVGPLFVTYTYTKLGPRWVFGILFVVLCSSSLLLVIFYKRMIPMKVNYDRKSSLIERNGQKTI